MADKLPLPIYQSFTCHLMAAFGRSVFSSATDSVVAGIGSGVATVAMEGLVSLPIREQINLYCRDSVAGAGNFASGAVIDAIHVG